MTNTLGTLKARIADDLARSDLSDQIAAAITDAITHYEATRFYFNEQASTFVTVADRAFYDQDDLADIPNFFDFDAAHITIDDRKYRLCRMDAVETALLASNTSSTGQPYSWAWEQQGLWLYPIPDDVYTITVVGAIKIAAPTDDADSANVWIAEAFEMIRCYAKALLYAHVIKSAESTQLMDILAARAKYRLTSETGQKRATGSLDRTDF